MKNKTRAINYSQIKHINVVGRFASLAGRTVCFVIGVSANASRKLSLPPFGSGCVILLLIAFGLIPLPTLSQTNPVMSFSASDPGILTDSNGGVTFWPDMSGSGNDAISAPSASGPSLQTVTINGASHQALHFDGTDLLAAPVSCPPTGSFFIVVETTDFSLYGQRVVGWEDSDVGQNGLGIEPAWYTGVTVVMRDQGSAGDLAAQPQNTNFELLTVTWGAAGNFFYRNGNLVASGSLTNLSSDPNIPSLMIGGPGSGSYSRFGGDILALVCYDQQLAGDALTAVQTQLYTNYLAAPLPYVVSTAPTGSFAYPTNVPAIQITLQDGLTAVSPSTIQLFINQQAVTPTVVTNMGGQTTPITLVSNQPPISILENGTNTVEIVYGNNATPSVFQTNEFSFVINPLIQAGLLTVTPAMLSGSVDVAAFQSPIPYGDVENTNSEGWSWNNGDNIVADFHYSVYLTGFAAYSTDPTDFAGATWTIRYSNDDTNWTTITNFDFGTFAGGGTNDDGSTPEDMTGWYSVNFNSQVAVTARYWQVTQTAVTGGMTPVVGPLRFFGFHPPGSPVLPVMSFTADDPAIVTDSGGSVTLWPDESGFSNNAVNAPSMSGPSLQTVSINGANHSALYFDGTDLMAAPVLCSPHGSLFIVMEQVDSSVDNQRTIGWADSAVGRHGVDIEPSHYGYELAIDMRDNNASGDLFSPPVNSTFELITITWGAAGDFLYRNSALASSNTLTELASDPNINHLMIGGPGSGYGALFNGYILALTFYDQQLTDAQRSAVESQLLSDHLGIVTAPVLSISSGPNNTVIISWQGPSVLQSALQTTGSWTDVPGAASPQTMPISGPAVFFRLRSQ